MAYTTIDDPSAHFQIALYTGNQTGRSITYDGNSDMQPDWLWGKSRSNSDDPTAIDSSRGVGNVLTPSDNSAEGTGQSQYVTSFNSDGFGLGTDGGMNRNNYTYVSWGWKANGGTTATNNNGDVTTTVQANTTAGFSIITYDGNNAGGSTVGHGLGAVPDMLIAKSRVATKPWQCYHKSIGNDHFIDLNVTTAKVSASASWSNTTPTSSIVTLGNGDTNHTGAMVMYCFTSIQGYSKFGSYTANNSTDGPFVYLGFKPAWILVRNTSAAADWPITDNKREVGNPFGEEILFANASDAETNYSGGGIDFLSNGFKIRSSGTNGVHNANNTSHKFIYMAFAESPFVSSEGVPTTAR